jgi:N-acyl-phosphatidylethanolamine-hydrolysing phospholipase D
MSSPVYRNSYPHPLHGLLDVLRWKLGLGPRELPPPGLSSLPPCCPQLRPREKPDSNAPPPERLQLTWVGHSTFLIRHRGKSILIDPIFGNCGTPLPWVTLRRAAPPGLTFASLPLISDVIISHSHYDHLDKPTIKMLGDSPNYWLPAGLAKWFHRQKIRRCRGLDWWQSTALADGMEIHCVPAQHFAARGLFDRNRTHWCGWVLRTSDRSIYFVGDTGYCPVFKEIGARFGGFDLSLVPIGAFRPRWLMRPMHVDPDEAVQIHLDVRSRHSVASHWGTFALTDEPFSEPPLLLQRALAQHSIPPREFRVLDFGETIEV